MNTFKYHLIPVEKNLVFVRLENIGDKFDPLTGSITFNLDAFTRDLYVSANSDDKTLEPIATITEMSLTGN